ncbi:MAG: DUF4430 domain-containing protein [Candidatus Aenigmarchaeota archaeon]|nr:DUF4430 domain-containing protein [Candidatus Aenigmarchaeota archaeon]
MNFGSHKASTLIKTENVSTVFDVLSSVYTIKYKDYGDMGIFLTSINNVSQNSSHSWIYFVNGKLADKAADKYILFRNSTIEWKYMKNNDIMKLFSNE